MHEIPHLTPAGSHGDEARSSSDLAVFIFVIALLAGATGVAFWIGAALSDPANQQAAYQAAEEFFP